jgi:hypothetical protein
MREPRSNSGSAVVNLPRFDSTATSGAVSRGVT